MRRRPPALPLAACLAVSCASACLRAGRRSADADRAAHPRRRRWPTRTGSARRSNRPGGPGTASACTTQRKRDGRDDPRHVRAADRRRRGHDARRRRARRRSMPRNPVFDAQRTRMAFVRNGDVFVRDLRSGALHPGHAHQRRRSAAAVGQRRRPVRSASATTGIAGPRATACARPRCVRAEKDPDAPPEADDLRDRQLRLIDTLRNDRAQTRRRARAGRGLAPGRSDPRAARRPTSATTSRSPTARCRPTAAGCWWSPRAKGADNGTRRQDAEVRDRIGLRGIRGRAHARRPQRAGAAAPVAGGRRRRDRCSELKFDALPGIAVDPLAALRKAAASTIAEGQPRRAGADLGDNSGAAVDPLERTTAARPR